MYLCGLFLLIFITSMSHYITTAMLAFAICLVSCKSEVKPTNAETNAGPKQELDSSGNPVRMANPWLNSPCDVITDQEFYAVFGIEEKRDLANRDVLPGKAFCLRRWKKPDWREREIAQEKNPDIATNPESALVVEVLNYGTLAVASAQYDMHKKDHINGYTEEFTDLGEGAIWSPNLGMLMVKKGHLCLQLKLDHADNPADNLPKIKELAAIALKKM